MKRQNLRLFTGDAPDYKESAVSEEKQARDCKREDCFLHFESPARFWELSEKILQRSYSSSFVYSSQ